VIEVDENGVRSIAGFKLRPMTRRIAPTIARTRHALGRGRVTRGRYSSACSVRWRRLGLQATFVNFGARPPCTQGLLQEARITGPRARRWAARVANLGAVVTGSSIRNLVADDRASSERTYTGRRIWTLAEMYWPIGPGDGYIPSVWAYGTSTTARYGGSVRGFGFWVGAGGD
jgi:hypothetical protein